MPSKDDEIGGLWARQGRNGEFLSGRLTLDGQTVEVVVFPNTYKQEGERTPDWRVYRSQPRDQQQNGRSGPPQGGYKADRPTGRQVDAARAAQGPQRPQAATNARGGYDDLDDEIPF